MSLGGVSTYPLNHRSRSHSDFNILARVDMFTAMDPLSTAMDPLARFHADRFYAAWMTIKEENACRFPNYVKLFDAKCSVSQSERRQLHDELEANLPSVSERLDCPRRKTFDDRSPRWVPPRSRTPSPAPRYGRGEGGRRIQSPEAIRIIRAQSVRTLPPPCYSTKWGGCHTAEHSVAYRHLVVAGELRQRRCNCGCARDDPRCEYQWPRVGQS